MKRLMILTAVFFLALVGVACASPALTDGESTAWIGDGNVLYLQSADGTIRQTTFTVGDVLSMSETEVFCLSREGQVYGLRLDGQSGRLVNQRMTEEELNALRERPFRLAEGILTAGEEMISTTALAADSDGKRLVWAEMKDGLVVLKTRNLPEKEAGNAGTLFPTETQIPLENRLILEPVSLVLTRDGLTLTAADHRVLVIDPETGACAERPGAQWQTTAACVADKSVFRYIREEDGTWTLETKEALPEWATKGENMLANTAMPVPTQTPTPTPTPRPTATPKPTANTTSRPEESTDDKIYKGASGSTVRKIQKRLTELGYPVGKIDGVYGEQTQVAINLFCDAIHVREHNYITPSVRRKLMADNAPIYDPFLPLQKGDRGLSVLYMQRRLRELGYDPGKLDGIYGTMTIAAAARFQADYGFVLPIGEIPGEKMSHDMMTRLFWEDPASQTDLG